MNNKIKNVIKKLTDFSIIVCKVPRNGFKDQDAFKVCNSIFKFKECMEH